jgi:hypothetical protein
MEISLREDKLESLLALFLFKLANTTHVVSLLQESKETC